MIEALAAGQRVEVFTDNLPIEFVTVYIWASGLDSKQSSNDA